MGVRFQSVLQDFRDIGITAADMTADEIVALVHACERVDNPYSDINADLCEQPVQVCRGIYFWPITAGAQIWLADYAAKWWPHGTMMYKWAQAYALMNARNPDAFAKLTDKWTARLAVSRAMLRLCCHRRELAVAVNRCYGIGQYDVREKEPKSAPEEQAADFAHYVATLEVESGIPARTWLFGRGLRNVATTYRKMTALKNAFGGAASAEKMTFELNDALTNLANVKSLIMKRIEAERAKHE